MAENVSKASAKGAEEATSGLVVVDIGKKQKKKRIRRLRKGRGALFDKVRDVVEGLQEDGAVKKDAEVVVVVVRQKARRFGRRFM